MTIDGQASPSGEAEPDHASPASRPTIWSITATACRPKEPTVPRTAPKPTPSGRRHQHSPRPSRRRFIGCRGRRRRHRRRSGGHHPRGVRGRTRLAQGGRPPARAASERGGPHLATGTTAPIGDTVTATHRPTACPSPPRRPSSPRMPTPGHLVGHHPSGGRRDRGVRRPGQHHHRGHRHPVRQHQGRLVPRRGLPHGVLRRYRRPPGAAVR